MTKRNPAPVETDSEAIFSDSPATDSHSADIEQASDVSEAARRTAKAARDLRRAQALARGAMTPSPIDAPPAPLPISPEISRLDNILQQVESEGKFEVHRQAGGASIKVGVFPISEYPDRLETIACEYKGGTFKTTFKDKFGHIRGQDTQTYDAMAYGSGSRREPEPQSNNSSAILEKMLERMEARETEQRREMAEIRLESQRMMLEMMKLAQGNSGSNNSMSVLDAIKLGKEMAGPQIDPVNSLSRTLEAIAMLKDGVKESEPQSPIVFAIEKALEMVSPIVSVWAQKASATPPLKRTQAPAPGAVADRQVLPPPAASVKAPAQAVIPSVEVPAVEEPIDPRVKEYAAQLLTAGQNGMRASLLAQLIVDGLPNEGFDEFESMLEDPNTVTNLLRAEPKLAPYTSWLSTLMTELQDYFDSVTASDGDDLPPAPAPAPAPAPSAVEAVVSTPENAPTAPITPIREAINA